MQRSVERSSLAEVPLDFVCDAVGFFEHVKELKCTGISDPQQVCLAVQCLAFTCMGTAQCAEYSSLEKYRQQTPAALAHLLA